MTKAKMIETLQKLEAEKWLRLKEWQFLSGRESVSSRRARTAWVAVSDILEALEVEVDTELKDYNEARQLSKLIHAEEKRQAEIEADMAKRD